MGASLQESSGQITLVEMRQDASRRLKTPQDASRPLKTPQDASRPLKTPQSIPSLRKNFSFIEGSCQQSGLELQQVSDERSNCREAHHRAHHQKAQWSTAKYDDLFTKTRIRIITTCYGLSPPPHPCIPPPVHTTTRAYHHPCTPPPTHHTAPASRPWIRTPVHPLSSIPL
ncbi:LAME_0F01684g1_1 [Lachancea meyersii CBS 8951]|uniref:LAME_0F01684g1_1 n=1 Tax=Lachancea meyersii CBS 8951 TaxID=1266667 RepID=A0A1G4JPX6_9SACH|nr:LAME_0F01684g1_1 [Lachancea meyersii CBS 8951]